MRKGLCLELVAGLILGARSVDAQVINPVSLPLPAAYRTLSLAPYREDLERFLSTFSFHRQADGGGDGSGSGTGTGSSGDTGSSGSDSNGSASDSTGPGDNSDPDADPSTTDNSIGPDAVAPPTDPTDFTALDAAAQQAYDAVANPFGGVPGPVADGAAGSGVNPVSGVSGSPEALSPRPPGGSPTSVSPPSSGAAPVTRSVRRNHIHAVIVSGLSDPSQVLTGNVELTGGIVALGPPDPTNPQIAGHWDPNVRITPDPELLNGHKIPPLVPNVIDVRIMHHEVSATIESEGTISGHP